MPLYKHNNKSVFHIHIPKTGGTVITDALKENNCIIEIFHKQPDPVHKVTPQHFHYNIWKNLISNTIPKIVGWRDPWHRTVSEFVWQTRTKDFNKLNDWLSQCLKMYLENHSWGDNHFRPQTEFFQMSNTTYIMPYEKTMNTAKQLIKRFLDIDIKFKTTPQKRLDYTLPPINDVLQLDVKHTWEKIYHKDLEFDA